MNNKKITVFGFCLLPLVFSTSAFAASYTVLDQYVGGNSANPGNTATQEIIGVVHSQYAVSRMDVDFTGNTITLDVYSQFLDNVGVHNTYLGDLFISVSSLSPNGWNPEGTKPWASDVLNGENWEYVLSLDYNRYSENDGNNKTDIQSGSVSLYDVNGGGTVVTPESQPASYIPDYYRTGQEIYYDPATGQSVLALGSWEIFGLGTTDDTDDYLRFIIDYDFGVNYGDFAFHWTMTCANDVIEGGVANAVPEPGTMFLFGAGLMSLVSIGSKKKNLQK